MAIIDKPSDYFETVTYTASTSSSYSETSLQFQPDFIWLKNRDTTYPHHLFDAVRGSSLGLSSNSTDAEQTRGSSYLTSFDSNGFTTGNAIASDSADGVVAWNWKAGGTAVSNTDGSITSSVSANQEAGFSIVSYTGNSSNSQTVGHGLGVAPSMVIIKNRVRSDEGWWTQHTSFADGTYYALLNSNSSAGNSGGTNIFNGFPTSTVFKLNDGRGVNESGSGHIAYCFAEKQGYSKFGSYVGNGGNQFIYTGFKPAFVIEKRSSNVSEWDMYDNKRNTFNSVTKVLKPNASDAEATYGGLNFLSNGFEAKGSLNDSGQTLIYMAFAESPFVSSTGVPTTAR